MDTSLVMYVAPMGCYSAGAGIGSMQRETQGYIHSLVRCTSEQERRAVIRQVLSSKRGDKVTRAAVECFFFRNARVHEWHLLTDERKSTVVEEFIARVWLAAAGIAQSKGQQVVAL